MEKKDLIIFRPMEKTDENLIYTFWLRGLRFGNTVFSEIDEHTFFKNYREVINRILANPSTFVNIACLKEDPDVVLGFSVVRGHILDWVFVKPQWRKLGIANDLLLNQKIDTVSHITAVGNSIRKAKKLTFNPFN